MQDNKSGPADLRAAAVTNVPAKRKSLRKRLSFGNRETVAGPAAEVAAPVSGAQPAEAVAAQPDNIEPDESSLIDALKFARREQDFLAMLEPAEMLRRRFPQAEPGYQLGALALRELGRLAEAAAVLAAAEEPFNNRFWLLSERAMLAQQAGDWEGAVEQARLMRQRFPNGIFGWRIGFNALHRLGRSQETDRLLDDALERFPGEEWLLTAAMSAGLKRSAWPEVTKWAATLRQTNPSNEQGWIGGLRSLRVNKQFEEAAALLKEAEAAQPGEPWLLEEAANLSQAAGNLVEALKQWQRVRYVRPDRQSGYIGGFQVSMALGRYDEAETILRELEQRFSQTAFVMVQGATLAQRRCDYEEAIRCWEATLKAYPKNEEAYRGKYQSSRQLGKLKEAGYILDDALFNLPQSRWALMEAAQFAQERFDYLEADRRWGLAVATRPEDTQIALKHAIAPSLDLNRRNRDWTTTNTRLAELNQTFPNFVEGWRTHIYSLRSQDKTKEAAQLATECVRRFPDEPELWLEHAFIAADEGAPDEAVQRLEKVAERFPQNVVAQYAFAQSLSRARRLNEADRQYRLALDRFPDHSGLVCGYAANAAERHDWTEALRRWTKAREQFPLDRRAIEGALDAHAALTENDTFIPPPKPMDGTDDERSEREQLFWRFESLGGTGQGCEFGIVQRIAGGAEPLGLLRWSNILSDNLLDALNSRFEGVGTAEQTLIDFYETNDPGNPEYRCRDKRYETVMHTFIFKKDMPEEKMFLQTCRRMAFLRRRLIQDLEAGEKIFVYKIFQRNLSDQEITRLHQAMRSYGNNTLLYVRYADDLHPSGTVVPAGDGLLIGYISGFTMIPPDARLRPADLPAWTAICKAALALHETARPKVDLELTL